MSSDFSYVRLADYTDKIGSGSTPRGGSSVYLKTGQFTLFRSQNIYNNGFSLNGLVYITVDAADKLKSVSIQEDDILLNITGDSVARVCIAPKELLPARVNQHVSIIRVNKTEFDSKYLRYFLSSPRMQKTMLSLASTGGTRNALTKSMIENFDVPKPLLQEQQKIASILSSLDDKIELNNKMNQTLEQMAQTIFKEWFEEFNFPNAEGKPYKTNGGAMHPSELGEIPEGLQVKNLNEISELIMGQSPKSETYNNDKIGFPLINGASDFDGVLPKPKKYTTKATKITQNNDIVFGIRATIGNVVFIDEGYCLGRGVAVVRTSSIYRDFLFILLSKEIDNLASLATGSVFASLRKNDIEKLKIIEPDENILTKFSYLINPFFKQIKQNQQQTQTLTKLRDTLLPKLMSGEIKV